MDTVGFGAPGATGLPTRGADGAPGGIFAAGEALSLATEDGLIAGFSGAAAGICGFLTPGGAIAVVFGLSDASVFTPIAAAAILSAVDEAAVLVVSEGVVVV